MVRVPCALDAARLLHFPDPAVRVRTAVGDDRRRRRCESAGVLPAEWSAPLRHVCADDGHDVAHRGPEAVVYRSAHLPILSRPFDHASDSSPCHDGGGGQRADWPDGNEGDGSRKCCGALASQRCPLRSRPSCFLSELTIALMFEP
jgi:hypothetical protein